MSEQEENQAQVEENNQEENQPNEEAQNTNLRKAKLKLL